MGKRSVLAHADCYRNHALTKPARISVGILVLITFIGNFTQLQLSAALPTIVNEFHITVTSGQWMTSMFQLVMGIMVPLTAYLTRRFSTRQIVITSVFCFTVGSFIGWLGPTYLIVLSGRTLEAIGTGVMWPVLQITIFSIFPLSRRGMAMGTVGMAMSVSPAIGPTIGGWQTEVNGWRSIFLSLGVIGIIILILAYFFLYNFDDSDRSAKVDFFSTGLSVVGFGGLLFGFTNVRMYPVTHPLVWATTLIGIVSLVWFVLRQIHVAQKFHEAEDELQSCYEALHTLDAEEQTTPGHTANQPVTTNNPEQSNTTVALHKSDNAAQNKAQKKLQSEFCSDTTAESTSESQYSQTSTPERNAITKRIAELKQTQPPLLDLGVFHNRSFTIGTVCASISFFAFSSIIIILPLYIQDDRGYTAIMSGLILLPGAIGESISQFVAGRMLDRFGARPVAVVGSMLLFFGSAMMAWSLGQYSWIWWISVWQIVRLVGVGCILMPVTTWALNSLEPHEVSAGSAVTNTIRQCAGAIGTPVIVILLEIITQAKYQAIGAGLHHEAIASIFGVKSVLFISDAIILLQVALIVFGVKGNGAGSTRDMTHRALVRMHHSVQTHMPRLPHPNIHTHLHFPTLHIHHKQRKSLNE